ncbi:MAG: hypothetical protein LBD10_12650 [Desulfobulbus sp.]|uniref:hypothetical protein n=1 Tax=Desulfobulbus sp. TaxID=895 RepID=UPI002846858D|nr:hypothetical protein [Desulfobulbus sp.]MDR2551037.1 hypothetical protein [Desulfobulbus sp.]
MTATLSASTIRSPLVDRTRFDAMKVPRLHGPSFGAFFAAPLTSVKKEPSGRLPNSSVRLPRHHHKYIFSPTMNIRNNNNSIASIN